MDQQKEKDDISINELKLSPTLLRYFGDLFLCCKEEDSSKVSLPKTIELLKSGNIDEHYVQKISQICCPYTASYLNKKEFFSALKLAAAYRANIPILPYIVKEKLDLPLPVFTWHLTEKENKTIDVNLIELSNENEFTDTSTSTDSEADSETIRQSESASRPDSDSPTPTNSVDFWTVDDRWRALSCDEQRQLLGTEEESSDKHSSEDDTEISTEVWTITPEQREYYTKEFKKLQDNTNALLAGTVARTFFERSQLPVHELRKIWQLSDVTRDGALSLSEFNTAMHLVVLRKHNIPIPDVLPPSLVPKSEVPVEVAVVPVTEPVVPVAVPAPVESEAVVSPQSKEAVKGWTKFAESPTNSVSSPGPKPISFYFHIDQNDPNIRHPVPRRLTPEVALQQTDEQNISSKSPKKTEENNLSGLIQNLSLNNQRSAIQRVQPKKVNVPGPGSIPPPPTTQLSTEEVGPVSLPAFPPPKKEKPPPPPPRPFKTHGRSSSLDLNRLSKLGAPPVVPPRVSPNNQSRRFVTQQSEGGIDPNNTNESGTPFINFTQFEKYEGDEGIFPGETYEADRKRLFKQLFSEEPSEPRKHGAFEVYRKPNSRGPPSRESPADPDDEGKWREFKKLQTENAALLRTCQELSQTLADLQEEKMKLRVRLEQLEEEENVV